MITGIAPGVTVIDLHHAVAPHDVGGGARRLAQAAPWLSPVVLAIVDPGVGTGRRAVAIEAGDPSVVLIGPDNGLLLPAARSLGGIRRAVALDDRRWHRRPGGGADPTPDAGDVFAPAAGYVAGGVDVRRLGSAVDPDLLVALDPIRPVVAADGVVHAHVLATDRFGNVQLDVALPPPGPVLVRTAGRTVGAGPAATYGDIPLGALGLVVDSDHLVSLACFMTSAATLLGLRPGDPVSLHPQG